MQVLLLHGAQNATCDSHAHTSHTYGISFPAFSPSQAFSVPQHRSYSLLRCSMRFPNSARHVASLSSSQRIRASSIRYVYAKTSASSSPGASPAKNHSWSPRSDDSARSAADRSASSCGGERCGRCVVVRICSVAAAWREARCGCCISVEGARYSDFRRSSFAGMR